MLSCDLAIGHRVPVALFAKVTEPHPLGRGSFGAGGEGHGGGGGLGTSGLGMSENIHLGSTRLYGGSVGVHVSNQIIVYIILDGCADLLLPLGNILRHWNSPPSPRAATAESCAISLAKLRPEGKKRNNLKQIISTVLLASKAYP